MLCVCTVNTHWQQADTVCRTKSTYQLDRSTGGINHSWIPCNNEKSTFGEVQTSHPASENNFINSAFMCTKAIAGSWREGWMRCVNMTYSLTPTSKSASPIFLPSCHSGEQDGGFLLQTARRLSRWIVFCQMTSLSWLAISLCEKW